MRQETTGNAAPRSRIPARLSAFIVQISLMIAFGGGLVAFLKGGAETGIGFAVLTFVGGSLLAGVIHLVAAVVTSLFEGLFRIGGLLGVGDASRPPPPPSLPPPLPRRPAPTHRPVRFLHEAGASTADPALQALAIRALGTVDLLTRRLLKTGDRVFLCRGGDGRCGAAIPADIRDEIRKERKDCCPSCGEAGRFVAAVLPAQPEPVIAIAVASTWPAAALQPEAPPLAHPFEGPWMTMPLVQHPGARAS